jgi:hypothetical protein
VKRVIGIVNKDGLNWSIVTESGDVAGPVYDPYVCAAEYVGAKAEILP